MKTKIKSIIKSSNANNNNKTESVQSEQTVTTTPHNNPNNISTANNNIKNVQKQTIQTAVQCNIWSTIEDVNAENNPNSSGKGKLGRRSTNYHNININNVNSHSSFGKV